jgi:hypothetical protein
LRPAKVAVKTAKSAAWVAKIAASISDLKTEVLQKSWHGSCNIDSVHTGQPTCKGFAHMSNTLTFCTTLDQDTLEPVEFTVTGTLLIEGEQTPIGLSSANFDRVFDELSYWTRLIDSVDVKFTTVMFNI